jgi:hypothetical protein
MPTIGVFSRTKTIVDPEKEPVFLTVTLTSIV